MVSKEGNDLQLNSLLLMVSPVWGAYKWREEKTSKTGYCEGTLKSNLFSVYQAGGAVLSHP